MSEIRNAVAELYKHHGLEFNEEFMGYIENGSSLSELLYPLSWKHKVCEVSLNEFPWDCCGDLHNEFSRVIKDVVKSGNGNVKIGRITARNKYDEEEGETESEGTISISFKHNEKTYSWCFEAEDHEEYYAEVMEWAASALGEEFYYESGEILRAWCVPTEVLVGLKEIANRRAA